MNSSKVCGLVAAAIALVTAIGCAESPEGKTIQFAPVASSPTGDLTDARFAATATVLSGGLVLIAGGVANEGPNSAAAELYDPATGGFSRTGSLSTGRAYHTATLLKDGRVLIAGGLSVDGQPLDSAELYDPASARFTTTGSMLQARYNLTASILPNGKVLIAGGDTAAQSSTSIDTAELYDSATGTFGATGNVTRYYDPSIEKFYYKGKMIAAHGKHSATVMKDGNVLIAGGEDAQGTAQAAAEIYDWASGKFIGAGAMKFARREHRATLLRNGEVLITGGVDREGKVLATAELYNPATRKFTMTANMNEGRAQHATALLANGEVLIAGGSTNSRSAELYDPARGAFTCVGGGGGASGTACNSSMNEYRSSAMDALLRNGEVLIAGGYDFHMSGRSSVPFSVLWSAEVYNPASGTFVSTVSIAHAHFGTPSQ